MSLNIKYDVAEQLGPKSRLKFLYDFSGQAEIDYHVNPKLYYKSGVNMFKQFNLYYKEGSWENAVCIYLKYEKLFFDKIRHHPGYGTIPVNIKSINAMNFRIIKPKAEHAKRELFKRYQRDYAAFLEETKGDNFEYFENNSGSAINQEGSDTLNFSKSKQSDMEISMKRAMGSGGGMDVLKMDFKPATETYETTRKPIEPEKLHNEVQKFGAKKRIARQGSLTAETTSV